MNNQNIEHLYIHVPFCLHLCNYCDFYKTKWEGSTQVDLFNALLKKSLENYQKTLLELGFKFFAPKTIYLGGGTASLWGSSGASFIKDLFSEFEISMESVEEFTMEIDPLAWTGTSVEDWINVGVNRWSVGAQSMDDGLLKLLDRAHLEKDIVDLLVFLDRNKQKYSADLMIGLPDSGRKRSVARELEKLLALNCEHVSVYMLETRKHYVHQSRLPPDSVVADEYKEVCRTLKMNGLNQYEVSNFAKKNAWSRHNTAYWDYKSVLGIGPSATSLLVLGGDRGAVRHKWKPNSPFFISEELSKKQVLIEKLFVQTRTTKGVSLFDYFSGENLKRVKELQASWGRTGHAYQEERLRLTEEGMLLQDFFIGQLIAYL